METTIKKIAKVYMGYPFRSRLERVEDGNVFVIQMKDIDENSRLDVSNLIPVNLPAVKDIHRINQGDLIFRSRGRINTATLVQEPLENTVAAAPLLRLRVKKDSLMPEYLAWYINQPKSQTYLERQAAGTISRMINKTAVEEMGIEIPPLERQKHIIAIARLSEREQILLRRLGEKRKIHTDALLMQFAGIE
jgi:restriction endonuclease S subunit